MDGVLRFSRYHFASRPQQNYETQVVHNKNMKHVNTPNISTTILLIIIKSYLLLHFLATEIGN